MTDVGVRELERRALRGDVEAKVGLARARLRAGARDPRRWPRSGDVVRVAMHGAGVERWDTRRVVPCSEALGWTGEQVRVSCYCIDGDEAVSFAADSPELHWERTPESFTVLRAWGGWRVRGTMHHLGSWRGWAKAGEVVVIAGDQ